MDSEKAKEEEREQSEGEENWRLRWRMVGASFLIAIRLNVVVMGVPGVDGKPQ